MHPAAIGPSVVLVRRADEENYRSARLIDLGLTPRQAETAVALARTGGTNTQLARSLVIAEGTVKKHLEAVFRTLGVDSRAAAVAVLQQMTTR